MKQDNKDILDPCAKHGPTQQWAIVWFFGAIAIGAIAAAKFSSIDDFMYKTNAQMLDYNKYTANRVSSTTLMTEEVDPRTMGDFASAVKHVK